MVSHKEMLTFSDEVISNLAEHINIFFTGKISDENWYELNFETG